MNKPELSIIVPVYNVQQYLEKSLEALINQTLKNIEIIVVDDGSTDNCPDICDSYAKKDSRIKVIHKCNQGLGMARNSGLEVANGKYVTFLDSDDNVDANFYENMYNEIRNSKADAVWGEFKRIDKNDKILKKWNDGMLQHEYSNNEIIDVILKNMINGKDIRIPKSVWSWMYDMKLIKKNNLKFCSERQFISEDLIFQLDILPLCKTIVKCNKDSYYYYRVNDKSLSRSYKEDRFEKFKELHIEVCRKLKEQNIYSKIIDGENGLFMRKC